MIAYYRISILQNSILIHPTLLEISKLSMLEIFLFAVFSYCTFKLAIKRIDKSIIIFCILSWFWDYPQRGRQGYRFGFSVVTSLFVVESITKQWNIDTSSSHSLFPKFPSSQVHLLWSSEKMNLIPNQKISAVTLFEVFWWWINWKKMPVVCPLSTCIRATIKWIKILLMGRSGLFTPLWQFSMYNNHFGNQNKYKILA